jgi:type II secretory pathway pseudopilin PulG
MNLSLLTPKFWLGLAGLGIAAALLWFAYSWSFDRGVASEQAKMAGERLQMAQDRAKTAEDALTTTRGLTNAFSTQQTTTNGQLASLQSNLGNALVSLRNRPTRTSSDGVPSVAPTGPGVSGTGAALFREDGEFLTREAARADELRIKLVDCQAKYNWAFQALNSLKAE